MMSRILPLVKNRFVKERSVEKSIKLRTFYHEKKCYLPKSYEELKGLFPKELRFYWNDFYTCSLKCVKAKLRPLWYAIRGASQNVVNYKKIRHAA